MKQKQHYLSRFYLEFFTNPADGKSLYVYEKGGKPIRKSRPEHEAFRKDYYATLSPDGKRDVRSIEAEMARVEGIWKPSLVRIIDRQPLSAKDRVCVAGFLALTAMRSPSFHEYMHSALQQRYEKDWNRDRKTMLEVSTENDALVSKWRRRLQCSETDFQAILRAESVKLGIPLENCLQAMNWTNDLADLIGEMNWQLGIAPAEVDFVTSDTPVLPTFVDPLRVLQEKTIDPKSMQSFPALLRVMMQHSGTDLSFPISPKVGLYTSWERAEGYVHLTVDDVMKFNMRTVLSADRWVYASASSEALNRDVQLQTGSRRRLREA